MFLEMTCSKVVLGRCGKKDHKAVLCAFKKREHHSVFLSIIWIISLGACISQNFPFPCYSKYPLSEEDKGILRMQGLSRAKQSV